MINHKYAVATKVFQYSLNGKLLNVFNTIKNCKNYLDISQTIIDNFNLMPKKSPSFRWGMNLASC